MVLFLPAGDAVSEAAVLLLLFLYNHGFICTHLCITCFISACR